MPAGRRFHWAATLRRDMEGASQVDLERSAKDLLESPGGQIMSAMRAHLRSRAILLLFLFVIGFMVAFPFTGELISWLVEDSGYVPSGTEVVVLTPVELLALKLRVSAYFGMTLGLFLLLVDTFQHGLSHPAVKQRVDESGIEMPTLGMGLLVTVTASLLLVFLSQWWTLSVMVPIVLQYLAEDAASSGLDTTWRLSSFIGFILNLCFAGLVAFQTPVVTLLLLRGGAVERTTVSGHRRHIWFAAVVLGALLSPPDPLSMLLVSAPVVILFELAMLVDRVMG